MTSKIDVFSSSVSFSEQDVRGKTVVIIDVLRASSTIQTALENGAAGIIPLGESDDPERYTRYLEASEILLCGEKGGLKVEGYKLGNSPLEYERQIVEKKTIILKTTNGTQAIARCSTARDILIGSFLNLSALGNALKKHDQKDLLLICSGWNRRLSIEDLLCAGAILHILFEKKIPNLASDGVKVACGLFEKFGHDIPGLIHSSNHAKRLREIDYEEDVAYCSQVDLFSSVPRMKDGMISIK